MTSPAERDALVKRLRVIAGMQNVAGDAADIGLAANIISALTAHPSAGEPRMMCDHCGANRYKEDCKGDRTQCPFVSLAASPDAQKGES